MERFVMYTYLRQARRRHECAGDDTDGIGLEFLSLHSSCFDWRSQMFLVSQNVFFKTL